MCHMPLGVPAGDMSLAHPRGSRRAAFQGGRASEWASRETRRLPSRLGAGKPGSLRALGRRTGGPQGGGHPPTPPAPPRWESGGGAAGWGVGSRGPRLWAAPQQGEARNFCHFLSCCPRSLYGDQPCITFRSNPARGLAPFLLPAVLRGGCRSVNFTDREITRDSKMCDA